MLESSEKELSDTEQEEREKRQRDEDDEGTHMTDEEGVHALEYNDPVAAALSSLAASQSALVDLAKGARADDSMQKITDMGAPSFVKNLPKHRDMDWSSMPASPLMMDQHDVSKLLARADKWEGIPKAWDLREANKKLAKEIPSAQPTVSRENALFTQNILRALLLISADIERAFIHQDASGVLGAIR
jgi:hypothetical protein